MWTIRAGAQERDLSKPDSSKPEPKYDDTYSGSIVEFTTSKITVSRSILGKPAEKRIFLITSETRVEGKLRVKLKVTIGFVSTDDGDTARLIVVRQKPPDKK
jgi:hypothetical protein